MAYGQASMDAQDRTQWTIGELADEAGVSVRALRHYDHVGLLVPESRSFGGHRRYSEGDVERLYRIVALRRLGFGLATSRRCSTPIEVS